MGFLASSRRLTTSWELAPEGIVNLLINEGRMLSAYIKALRRCPSFYIANDLSRIIPSIVSVSEKQIDDMVRSVQRERGTARQLWLQWHQASLLRQRTAASPTQMGTPPIPFDKRLPYRAR
jgi:hypothetical protein